MNKQTYIKYNKLLESLDDDYYTTQLSNQDKQGLVKFSGYGVDWYGEPDKMIAIDPKYIDGRFGNSYDPDKMKSIINMIKNARDASNQNMEIICAYGFGTIVDLTDVIEHQESEQSGRFSQEYDGIKTPFSTGDSELDEYITDEGLVKRFEYAEPDDIELLEKLKFKISDGTFSPEQVREKIQPLVDDGDFEEDTLNEFLDLEDSLKLAIENNTGDLGDFRVQLRDGHHRVMGAIEAGERVVCLNLTKDDLPLIDGKSYVTRVT